MGLRYRRSVSLGGGVRVNLSRKGLGYSVGRKGVRVTKRADGRVQTTVSAPGTGLSYTTISGAKKKPKAAPKPRQPKASYKWEPKSKAEERFGYIMLGILLLLVLLVFLAS